MKTMENSWGDLLHQVKAVLPHAGDPRQLVSFADTLRGQLDDFILYDDHLPPQQQLVHYTSWTKALEILEDPNGPTLRMYNYEQTNDPQEGQLWRGAWRNIEEGAAWLDDYLPEYESTLLSSGRSTGSTYGCSFSSDVGGVEDNLTFWRLYGNDGNGCSFKVTGQLGKVYRVRYLDDRGANVQADDESIDGQIATWLEELMANGKVIVERAASCGLPDVAMKVATAIRRLLGGYHHLSKSRYFEDEREWRMVKIAPAQGDVRYETDARGVVRRHVDGLSLKDVLVTASSITIGPRVPNGGAARAYVEHLIRKKEIHVADVKLSKQIYRRDL